MIDDVAPFVACQGDKQKGDFPMRPLRFLLIAVLTTIVGMAGTFTLGPLDRDESRFMQATTQMLETGDYINIRFQEDERNKKPVGIYWLQAASVAAFSDVEAREPWAYRLPSFLGALIAALLVYWLGTRLFDEDIAFLGTILFISLPSFSGEATIAKTDAVLLATVVAAQGALAAAWMRARAGEVIGWGLSLTFWVALAIGILVKGPITPMISLLTIAALSLASLVGGNGPALGWLFRLRPVAGLVILLVVVSPWMIAIGIATEGRFFAEAIGTDMAGKITTGQESHGGPFGYHFAALALMFWPGVLFLPAAMRNAVQARTTPGIAFCLAWVIPSWLVFEIASTKLPHYMLPLYPALSLLCAAYILRLVRGDGDERAFRLMRWLGLVPYVIGVVAIAGLFLYGPHDFDSAGIRPIHVAAFAVILTLSVLVMWAWLRHRHLRSTLLSSFTGALLAWTLYQGLLPNVDQLQVSPRLSAALDEADLHPIRDDKPPVAMLGYNEPSIVFLLGTETRLSLADEAADWVSTPGRVAIVEGRFEDEFQALVTRPLRKISVISGHNYSNGRDVTLTVYQSQ